MTIKGNVFVLMGAEIVVCDWYFMCEKVSENELCKTFVVLSGKVNFMLSLVDKNLGQLYLC